MKYSIFIIGLFCLLTSCVNDYLEEPPTKNGVIPGEVADLRKYFDSGIDRNSNKYPLSITDDADLPLTAYDVDANGGFSKYNFLFFNTLFQRDYLSQTQSGSKTHWQLYYSRIYNDNYVLSMADSDKLKGSEDERKEVKSLARFDRALSMFQLATTYCQPWAPGVNDEELGLVLKNEYSLEFNEDNLGRKSLKATYEFIEKDILGAMNTPDTDITWGYTLKAVYAFAARFYLTIGKYEEAMNYADKAMAINRTIDDYTGYTTRMERVGRTYLPVVEQFWDKTIFNDYSILELESEYFVETMQMAFSMIIPSDELLDLYANDAAENDVRSWLFPEGALGTERFLRRSSPETAAHPLYMPYSYGGYMTTFANVAEMLLIKAECLVRVDGNIQQAKALLNELRAKRILNYDPSTVDNLSSNQEVLDFIFDERRRERPFVLRALDIRRLYALDGVPLDVTRNFFEIDQNQVLTPAIPKVYTLTPEMLANKLFEGDIIRSNGLLEQNP